MGVPITEFNQLPMNLNSADLNTASKRLAIDFLISTGDGNELDFGNCDITDDSDDSDVRAFCWQVTNFSSNTTVENLRLWLSSSGFDDGSSIINFAIWDLEGEWIKNATPPLSGEASMPTAEPSQNVYKATGEPSIQSGGNDTTQAIALYVHAAQGETLGVYKGIDASYEFQFSFKYDYF